MAAQKAIAIVNGSRRHVRAGTHDRYDRWRTKMRVWLMTAGIVAAATAGCGSDGDSATGPTRGTAATSYLDLRSEPGDYVGAGESHRYTLEDTVWEARADLGVMEPRHIYISLRPKNGTLSWWWSLNLAGPNNGPLAVGPYNDARRWPFSGVQPALDFSGTGRGCNTLTGSFVIREMVLGAGGTLDRFVGAFEQHCEGRSPALRGDISIAANPWR
jgi:hypothetical protein